MLTVVLPQSKTIIKNEELIKIESVYIGRQGRHLFMWTDKDQLMINKSKCRHKTDVLIDNALEPSIYSHLETVIEGNHPLGLRFMDIRKTHYSQCIVKIPNISIMLSGLN